MKPTTKPATESASLNRPLKKPRRPESATTTSKIRSTQFTGANHLPDACSSHSTTQRIYRDADIHSRHPAFEIKNKSTNPIKAQIEKMWRPNTSQRGGLPPFGNPTKMFPPQEAGLTKNQPPRSAFANSFTRLPSVRPETFGMSSFMTLPRS